MAAGATLQPFMLEGVLKALNGYVLDIAIIALDNSPRRLHNFDEKLRSDFCDMVDNSNMIPTIAADVKEAIDSLQITSYYSCVHRGRYI